MPSLPFKIPQRKNRSKISTWYKEAKATTSGPPSRAITRISNNLDTTRKNGTVSIQRRGRKINPKKLKGKCQELAKWIITLKRQFWITSKDKVAKDLRLTIFSISASSIGIGSAIVTGIASPPALVGLAMAVPTMTQKVIKLHSLKERAGGYRRLFGLIRKREAVVMVVGGATVGVALFIICAGDSEFETICNILESVIDSTNSVDASHFFDSVETFHKHLISVGPLKYTTEFVDLLPNVAKEAFGVEEDTVWQDKLPASQYIAIGFLATIAQLPVQLIVEEPAKRLLNTAVKRKVGWYKRKRLMTRH